MVWSSAYQGYRDIWAIGVIAYFLLCGYTPFDRETTAEEMQAILAGDYAFEPEEYWQDVSDKARDFIIKCLVVDADKRMSAEEALVHPFLLQTPNETEEETDLLPTVKSNLNLRRGQSNNSGLEASYRLIDQIKNGGGMDGAFSQSPENTRPPQKTPLTSSSLSRNTSTDETVNINITSRTSTAN